jgi:hypothetical protein
MAKTLKYQVMVYEVNEDGLQWCEGELFFNGLRSTASAATAEQVFDTLVDNMEEVLAEQYAHKQNKPIVF